MRALSLSGGLMVSAEVLCIGFLWTLRSAVNFKNLGVVLDRRRWISTNIFAANAWMLAVGTELRNERRGRCRLC